MVDDAEASFSHVLEIFSDGQQRVTRNYGRVHELNAVLIPDLIEHFLFLLHSFKDHSNKFSWNWDSSNKFEAVLDTILGDIFRDES